MGQLLVDMIHRLGEVYPPDEARAVARKVLEEGPLGLSPVRVFTGKDEDLSISQQMWLRQAVQRLLYGEPVQYVLGKEIFCELSLKVGPGVLIPRPETQDLVGWLVSDLKDIPEVHVLDACTGSGCIAVALAEKLPQAQILAVDVSLMALDYARENAQNYTGRVEVREMDILCAEVTAEIPDKSLHALVSNPPYVREMERRSMSPVVLEQEPSLALFVPDEDPLRFYRALGNLGQRVLIPGGALYVEINQQLGSETCNLFCNLGFVSVELRKDRYGNDRMVKAVKK